MKIIITTCILLSAIFSNAQTSSSMVLCKMPDNSLGIAVNGKCKILTEAPGGVLNDTLIISNWQQYKFIKIGDKVYQINSPTISEVQSPITLPFRWGGGTYWPYNGTIPTETTDILYDSLVLHGDTLRTIKRRK